MNISVTERLRELGLRIPPVPRPLAPYIPAVKMGDLVWTAGTLPLTERGLSITGRIGENLTVHDGIEAARLAALNALAAAGSECGGVDNITRIVRMRVYVACAPDFGDQPKIANAASELLALVFGSGGLHVRSAIGVQSLPMNAPVEIELVVEVTEPEEAAPREGLLRELHRRPSM